MANFRHIVNTDYIDDAGLEGATHEIDSSLSQTSIDFKDNDIVHGTIVKLEHDEVLVDIGFKSEGVIPVRELTIRKDANPEDVVAVGDEIDALVVTKEDKEGRLILSKKRAEYEKAWNSAMEKYKSGEVVTGDVIEIVRGGLILDIGLRAFLPASLVDLRRVRDLEGYLNTKIEARIIEMDKIRNNVVLSRRVLLEEGRHNERMDVLKKLTEGMKLKGKVSSIVDFGVFVDLGGIDGLVHISELSWEHVNHPNEVVSLGDEVEVVVLDVDLERERISLGIKQTTEDPWLKRAAEFPIDGIFDAEITRIVPFGAFVKLADDVEGLIHVSEIANAHIDTPAQVVHVGDMVKAKVVGINEEKHRVSLSMREAANDLGIIIEVEENLPEDVTPRERTTKTEDVVEEVKEEKAEKAPEKVEEKPEKEEDQPEKEEKAQTEEKAEKEEKAETEEKPEKEEKSEKEDK